MKKDRRVHGEERLVKGFRSLGNDQRKTVQIIVDAFIDAKKSEETEAAFFRDAARNVEYNPNASMGLKQ
ncbi:MAG: hypothetical protein HY886_03540 [Deltaproteobacteria bacterium]|nr:hypothetical protein [Deltaproteobacteria bacterium]